MSTTVPYDPELKPVLDAVMASMPVSLTPELLPALRAAGIAAPGEELLRGGRIHSEEHTVPGAEGGPDIIVTVYRRADHVTGGPGIYWIHGGGLVMGNRFTGVESAIEWVDQLDVVVATVEYRLAPEDPYPAAFDDCYAGLVWTAEHAGELGFDAAQLTVMGGSAGGNLTAAVVLAARDRKGPPIAAQILMCPMLDNRGTTISSQQFVGTGTWDRGSNETGWTSYLGQLRDAADVPAYAAPARATDFAGLPPTYLDAGSAEVFRDETIDYASRLWAAGVQAELHIWAGGFHGFDGFVPNAAVSIQSRDTRKDWFQRTFALPRTTGRLRG